MTINELKSLSDQDIKNIILFEYEVRSSGAEYACCHYTDPKHIKHPEIRKLMKRISKDCKALREELVKTLNDINDIESGIFDEDQEGE